MRISGAELSALFANGLLSELQDGLVAPNTSRALERIRLRAARPLTRDGHGIPDIEYMRRKIGQSMADPRVPYGLKITAPHTHWDKNCPIIISRTGERYILAEREPVENSHYWPVSFVFSPRGPLPYEWVDESIHIREPDYGLLVACIERVNEAVSGDELPLGLSIDYRFKQPLDPVMYGSSELQGLNGNDDAVVLPEEEFLTNFQHIAMEQVAWHAFSFDADLSDAESALVEELQAALRTIDDPAGRLRFERDMREAVKRKAASPG